MHIPPGQEGGKLPCLEVAGGPSSVTDQDSCVFLSPFSTGFIWVLFLGTSSHSVLTFILHAGPWSVLSTDTEGQA